MVRYATYAERLGWTPQQVDQLTLEQDAWLMPILGAIDAERAYQQKKADEARQRAAKSQANQQRGF